MFSKADKSSRNVSVNESARGPVGRGSVPSIISADLRITGDLECSGDIQIDGVVNGDIQSRNIVIGEGAAVTGSLQAETVQVFGKLVGEIKADSVTLERTAHVEGDIVHKTLAISQGAFLEGACRRLDAVVPAAASVAAPVEPLIANQEVSTIKAEKDDSAEAAETSTEDEDRKVERLQAAG
jgi:cytoskeletal protein CcmA (bactofilin family)